MNASNLLKAVLKPRSLSSTKRSGSGDGAPSRRSLSPDSRLPALTLTGRKSSSSPVKMTCMCSPTNHPGSFRCRYHRAQKQAVVALPTPVRRGASPSASRSSAVRVPATDTGLLSELGRTLPGRPKSMSRSPPARTSRLRHMTSGRDLENEDFLALSLEGEQVWEFKSTANVIPSITPVTHNAYRAAPSIMMDLPREIPTMFCQSTSKKALDVFDRSLTRMYL